MAFENPLAERGLPLVEGEIPVACGTELGFGAGDCAARIDEVGSVERRAAHLALVAVGLGVVAVGALAGDVAVGEELPGLGVVELLGSLFYELTLVVEMAEEFRRGGVVYWGSGAGIYVERYTQTVERVFDELVVTVDDILRSHALGASFECDRHTVLVAAADESDGATGQTEVTCVDIGRNIYSGEVTDVYRPVGVGQSRGYKGSLVIFAHDLKSYVAALRLINQQN